MASLVAIIREQLNVGTSYPGGHDDGIVIVAGGRLLASAYLTIRHLRRLDCKLPVQIWHLGANEIPTFWEDLASPLNVTTVDALRAVGASEFGRLGGWECKIHAIVGCPFEKVLLLDADNIPLRDPSMVLDAEAMREHGQIFWPDFYYKPGNQYAIRETAWSELGLPARAGQEIDSGQLAVNRKTCSHELQVVRSLNVHSDQCYEHLTWGDKDTFTLAWLLTKRSYHVIPIRPRFIDSSQASVFWQYWTDGQPLFQHQRKWFDSPDRMAERLLEDELEKDHSLQYLRDYWAAAAKAKEIPIPATRLERTIGKGFKSPPPSATPLTAGEWHRSGSQAFEQRNWTASVLSFQRAVTLEPANPSHRVDLAAALSKAGRPSEAIPNLLHALRQQGSMPEIHNNLGAALEQVERHDEAAAAYRNAIALRPSYVQAVHNLGRALRAAGDYRQAIEAFQEALKLVPDSIAAYEGIIKACEDCGDVDLMLEMLRRLIDLQPLAPGVRSWLLYNIHYHPLAHAALIYQEHLEWGRRFGREPDPSQQFDRDLNQQRRIRIGYMSPDFRGHTVPRFIGAALKHHDRSRFEVYCYSDVAEPDPVTDQIRGQVERWRDIVAMSDDRVAQIIGDDRIDVLVDLRGHASGNRMSLFARRAAPIQVNMVGYFDTTGLSAMDYRVTDTVQDPPGDSEQYHSETLLRFAPTCWCYSAEEDTPPVTALPFRKNGVMTFGSLNKIIKVTEPCAWLWARVLEAVPGSRLLLAINSVASEETVRSRLEHFGLPADRLDLVGKTESRNEYLERFGEIDIGLDTFPFNGITTSCDGLWMGVPFVSLAGGTTVSRAGRSILHGAGLGHLATDSPDAFVQAARALAEDVDSLEVMRHSMRQRMLKSRLMDHAGFTRGLETEYQRIWNKWCEEHGNDIGTVEPAGQ